MPVGRSGEFPQDFTPPILVRPAAHGQFERRLASRPAPDSRPGKEPPAQGVEFDLLQLAQAPLQEHEQVMAR